MDSRNGNERRRRGTYNLPIEVQSICSLNDQFYPTDPFLKIHPCSSHGSSAPFPPDLLRSLVGNSYSPISARRTYSKIKNRKCEKDDTGNLKTISRKYFESNRALIVSSDSALPGRPQIGGRC